jgi:hypothetical protein
VSKAAKEKSDVVTEAIRIGLDSKDTLNRIITVSKVKKEKKKKTKGKHDVVTEAGKEKADVSKAGKGRVNVSKAAKESTRFRPYGTSVQLPIRGKAQVFLKAQAGAIIATYVYISEDDSETSLLGKHDARGALLPCPRSRCRPAPLPCPCSRCRVPGAGYRED